MIEDGRIVNASYLYDDETDDWDERFASASEDLSDLQDFAIGWSIDLAKYNLAEQFLHENKEIDSVYLETGAAVCLFGRTNLCSNVDYERGVFIDRAGDGILRLYAYFQEEGGYRHHFKIFDVL